MICTNRQLAEMVSSRPESMSRLGAIEGIGKAKLENYGQDLLAILSRPRAEGGSPRKVPGQLSTPPSAEGARDC